MKRGILWAVALSLSGIGGVLTAHAATFNSTNFSINGNLGDSISGGQSSTNYQLTSAGGESVVGNGTSGSYKLGQGYVKTLEDSIELSVQPGNLNAYYPFDENGGKAVNDYAYPGNDGAFTSGSTQPTWATGKANSSLAFSNSDPVKVPLSGSNPTAGPITVSTWIYPGNLLDGNPETIISNMDGTSGFKLMLEGTLTNQCTGNTICFAAYIGGAQRTVTAVRTTALSNNTWAHVVATYDGSNLKLYVNGAEVSTLAVSGTITGSYNLPMCFGGNLSGGNCSGSTYVGRIDETKIFSRAFSAAEVAAEYAAENAGLQSALLIPTLTPGTSQSTPFQGVVQTSAPGYSLSINQNQNLTSGGNSIAPVSGSIASPVTWAESSTKGLGFTLYGTNGSAIPGKWGSGSAYAALPGSSTSFYTRTGYTAGQKDYLNMRLRLDTPLTQPVGSYSNQMVLTGTMTP